MTDRDDPGLAPLEVSVLVNGEHLASIDAVAADLTAAGLRVSEVLRSVGVITGVVDDPGLLPALGALDGVDAVEVVRTVQLAPPDAPVQ